MYANVSDLVKAGFDISNFSLDFPLRLKEGHAQHQGDCTQEDEREIIELNRDKQKPEFAFFSETVNPPGTIFHFPMGLAFTMNCPSGLVLPSVDPGSPPAPRPIHAGVKYAIDELGIKEIRVMSSGEAPILPFIRQEKPSTGYFMDMWRPQWDPVVALLNNNSRYRHTETPAERDRLTGIQLLENNTKNIDAMVKDGGGNSPSLINVVSYFYDPRDGDLDTYIKDEKTGRFAVESTFSGLFVAAHDHITPKYFGCSCCDSRALLKHAVSTKPGEFFKLYSIAGFIPNHHDVLQWGSPNSTFLQLEIAKEQGCTGFINIGHTKCGGIKALVKWCMTNETPEDRVLRDYLAQAKPLGDQVLSFARKIGIEKDFDTLCLLMCMHCIRDGARNTKRFVGKDRQVIGCLLDIDTREMYPLPLSDPSIPSQDNVKVTYDLLQEYQNKKLMTFAMFYDILEREQKATIGRYIRRIPRRSCDLV